MKKLFLLAISLALFSCSSDGDSNGGETGSGVAYIKGKLDGATFNYTYNNTVSDTHFYNSVLSISSEGGPDIYSYGGMLYPTTFTPSIMIAWDSMLETADSAEETNLFYNAFDNIPENYLTDAQYQNNEKGVDVQYEDSEGNFYNTVYGSQAGSSFNVASATEGMQGGLKTLTVTGTFSCKLYNSDNAADVKNFTDGKFKLILVEEN